jgi:siroheme synthase-like protein
VSGVAYPVSLDLIGRPCLVVGGAAGAARKVAGLLEAGARVTVLSPTLCAGLLALALDGRFRWWPREYACGDASGFLLVITTTGHRAVDDAVASDARARGALINCADDPARSDFTLPTVLRRSGVTVALSTVEDSPFLPNLMREEIEARSPDAAAALLDVVASVCRALRARDLSVDASH